MGWFSDVLKGNNHWFKEQGKAIKDNPERLLLGAMTPVGTKVWNKLLGKDWKPTHDAWGGPSAQVYRSGEEQGIDMGPAHNTHRVARIVTAAGMAGGAMGGGEGPASVQSGTAVNTGGGGSAASSGWTRFLNMPSMGGGGGGGKPEIIEAPEVEKAKGPEDWGQILARYNANQGALADGRRIEVRGDTAILRDEQGNVIGRAPNNQALYDSISAMETDEA